jgi:hypothetical protein
MIRIDILGDTAIRIDCRGHPSENGNHQLNCKVDSTQIPGYHEIVLCLSKSFEGLRLLLQMIFEQTLGTLGEGAISFMNPPFIEALPMNPPRSTLASTGSNHGVGIIRLETDPTHRNHQRVIVDVVVREECRLSTVEGLIGRSSHGRARWQ